MRVCILNDNFYRGSGITLVVQRLLRSDAFKEMELFLVGCDCFKGRDSFVEERLMVPEERVRTFNLMSTNATLLPVLLRFANWLQATRCDVIHAHHRRLAVLAELIRPLSGVPVLFTGHLTFPDARWFRRLSPHMMTGVSPSVVAYLKRATRASEVHLVYNPYVFGSDPALGSRTRERKVVSVGRLEPVKSHAVLIEAWARLRSKGVDAYLDIYGEGPLRKSLEALIEARQLKDRVFLRGFSSDLPDRLGAYSFHALVSEREGFPNAVIEAAARRLPTLLTDVDGSRDTLPEGLELPNALPFGDPESLATALIAWLEFPELVARDGDRFYKSLKALCELEVIGHQYEHLYQRLIAN